MIPRALSQLGRYELVRRLAAGGMGEVFLARERNVAGVQRVVVVKLLLPELAEDPACVAMFIDEARTAIQLVHPNIVSVYEFGQEHDTYFLAMEYVAGQNLARLCQRAASQRVGYPRNFAVHVVAEMAAGLHYAHNACDAKGTPMELVHRDVSPHNVLISSHGHVKLLDFGIARSAARVHRTQTGTLRGKLAYMSPEQAEQRELDARSDVFCAGIVLWETTLMKRLFDAPSELAIISRVTACEVPPPRDLDPAYPEELQAVVMTALARDPTQRFASAGELAAALREVLARMPRVETAELGALVTRLFPNDVAQGARDTAAATAEHEQPRATLSMPPSPPPANEVASTTEPGDGNPARNRRRTRWPMVAAIAVAILASSLTTALLLGGGSRQRVADEASGGSADATVAAPFDAGLRVAAVDAAPVRKPSPDAAARSPAAAPDAAVKRRHTAKRTVRRRPSLLDVPAGYGGLAVEATPKKGMVYIYDTPQGLTPRKFKLPVGDYEVSVDIPAVGRLRAKTVVKSRRMTRCRVTANGFTCR